MERAGLAWNAAGSAWGIVECGRREADGGTPGLELGTGPDLDRGECGGRRRPEAADAHDPRDPAAGQPEGRAAPGGCGNGVLAR